MSLTPSNPIGCCSLVVNGSDVLFCTHILRESNFYNSCSFLKTRFICYLERCTILRNSSSFALVTVNPFVHRYIQTLKTLQLNIVIHILSFVIILGEEFNNVSIFATALYHWIFSSGLEKKKCSKVYKETYVCPRTVEESMCLIMNKFATDVCLCTVARTVVSTGGEHPQTVKKMFSLFYKKTCIDKILKEWSCAFSCELWSKDNETDLMWFKSFF